MGIGKKIQLGNLFDRVTRKDTEINTNVVTISAQRGFINKRSISTKQLQVKFLITTFWFIKANSVTIKVILMVIPGEPQKD